VQTREAFVERMGLTAEADGFSRIAGRLFGALLFSEAPRSLDELAEQLGVSKASVSTEARRLLDRGVAERIGKPGDRRDYYALAPDFFGQLMRHRTARWASFHSLVRAIHAEADTQPRVVRERFAYLNEVHEFVLAQIERALQEWSDKQRARIGAPSTRVRASKRSAKVVRLG